MVAITLFLGEITGPVADQQAEITNAGLVDPGIYSVYARTRKTEALNFSISAALSDSDFRVLA